jgi:hypothetical protein
VKTSSAQVQVIKAKYEDTFADLGTTYDLGYTEMVAANPGVDAWLPGAGTEIVLPTRFILPPGPREGIVINLAEYRLYYFPKGRNVVYTFPLGIGREGWGSPIAHTSITAKTPNPTWTPPASIKAEHAADGDPLPNVVPAGPDNPLGPFKFTLGTAGLPDPRFEQEVRHRHAHQPRLLPHVQQQRAGNGRHGAGRHFGAHPQRPLQVRCQWRQGVPRSAHAAGRQAAIRRWSTSTPP